MRTIVVGAGSAGAIVAARLTEDERHEVVLVEAGPDYVRADAGELPEDLKNGRRNSMRAHDWGHVYRATNHRLWGALPMAFPRGRVVGGSSAVNTCIALRGQPYDFDEWAALGLPEWSWAQCLPAFKKLENDLDFDNEWHGRSGPIPIRRHTPDELVPWQAAFLEGCEELGFSKCADTNDPTTTGAGPHAMNKIDGERMSAARTYLGQRTRARPNLTITADTLVRRVRFVNKRAQGVEVERHGHVFRIDGDRVVLAGGAIATPGILLRSGVGPRDEIARLGVELVAHVPAVGARLLDHPGVAIFFWPEAKGFASIDDPIIQTVHRYTAEDSECPSDMQVQPGSFVPLPGSPIPAVVISACLGKPRGSGTIRLRSARATDLPILATSFLEDPEDAKRLHEALRIIARLADTKAIKKVARAVYPRRPFESGGLRGHLAQITGSGYHPSGTVPMGADDDSNAATDGRGRVRGVEGLYVVDASLMPTITSSNTNLPTLMMGERFGAWLKDA